MLIGSCDQRLPIIGVTTTGVEDDRLAKFVSEASEYNYGVFIETKGLDVERNWVEISSNEPHVFQSVIQLLIEMQDHPHARQQTLLMSP